MGKVLKNIILDEMENIFFECGYEEKDLINDIRDNETREWRENYHNIDLREHKFTPFR